jgi:hypothetical protein
MRTRPVVLAFLPTTIAVQETASRNAQPQNKTAIAVHFKTVFTATPFLTEPIIGESVDAKQ